MTTTNHNLKLRVLLAACWLAWHGCEVECVAWPPNAVMVKAARGPAEVIVRVYDDGTGTWSLSEMPSQPHASWVLTIFDIDPLCTALTST